MTFRVPAFLALAFLVAVPAIRSAEKRPNILFAFADDMGRYAGIWRQVDGPGTPNDVLTTPNIDRVATEGALFKNAYVTAPSCTPCRSSLLSGQYFWRTGRGAILSGAVWDTSIPVYPLLLKESGYHIGKSYKVWSPGIPADAPYGMQEHAYEKSGRRFNAFSQTVTQLVKNGQDREAAKAEVLAEVSGNFDAFLADRKPDQPFCFWFGPTNVHRMWTRGSGKALWDIDPDRLQGKMPPFLPDVPEVREDLADYFGEVQAFDAALGLMLAKLESIGELDNTIVVVSGDHGAPGFPHGKCNLYDFGTHVTLAARGPGIARGRVLDDFTNLMDLAPTFLEIGGVPVPSVMTGRSLLPVLTSEKSGQIDPTRTWVVTGRERHVDAAREGFLPYPQRALRTPEALYIINFKPDRWPMGDPYHLDEDPEPTPEVLTNNTRITLSDMDSGPTKAWLVGKRSDPLWKPYFDMAFAKRPAEELYLMNEDPQQVRNVAADPRYDKLRGEMRSRLLHELERTNDPRVKDDGATFENPPFSGPVPDDARAPKGAKKTGKKPPAK